jgi:hypothetical protein
MQAAGAAKMKSKQDVLPSPGIKPRYLQGGSFNADLSKGGVVRSSAKKQSPTKKARIFYLIPIGNGMYLKRGSAPKHFYA